MAATLTHRFACGETEAQSSDAASPQLQSKPEAGPGEAASFPHLVCYKAMTGKGNLTGQAGRQ